MPRSVVSIAAAPGWSARYVDGGEESLITLLAWALVEDGRDRNLVGFVQRPGTPTQPASSVILADEVDGFDGYAPTGVPTRRSK